MVTAPAPRLGRGYNQTSKRVQADYVHGVGDARLIGSGS
ncbi:hypothetical protein SHXM_08421 [Streptomyces hygroscopicus]|nr:hypothetical protein SHXM_08421 [Streptomyces hygroscopicus]